jgi:Tol biopolymer transport system component
VVSGDRYPGINVLALGTDRVRVAFTIRQPASAPSWSPDGREIAFIGDVRGCPDLAVVRSDGSGRRRLLNDVELPRCDSDSRISRDRVPPLPPVG